MIRGLTGLSRVAAEQRVRDFLLGAVATAALILFAAISLGFGTLAAYVFLRASEGRVVAALMIGAIYGLVAITIWVTLGRARCFHQAVVAPAAAATGNTDSLIQALAADGVSQEQLALVAAMRLGRELTPMQLLALALIGGYVAGIKIGK